MTHVQDSATSESPINRREALKLAGAALASALPRSMAVAATPLPAVPVQAQRSKKVIVIGGGIGGLCCAFEPHGTPRGRRDAA